MHYLEIVENSGNKNEEYVDREKSMDFYFSLPKSEKEKFADELKEKLTTKIIIPFQSE